MEENSLLNLVENIQTWDCLEKRIVDLPTERQRGAVFEEFCHAFFLLDPVFQFKNVYRQDEIPPSVRERLGYPGIQDLGVIWGHFPNYASFDFLGRPALPGNIFRPSLSSPVVKHKYAKCLKPVLLGNA